MKTALILIGLVALTLGVAVPKHDHKFKSVDAEFASKQKKVLSLFEHVEENDQTAECHKVGLKYNIEANIDKYTNPLSVHTHHAEADNKFSVIVDSSQVYGCAKY
ncbi:unnamed protein product [Arctia plantaginis]|uniref:Hemocyanin N-terminal domain-containing protein n=1 Tax=Arctia plantaginis TaxID=874455 RepID=A0A8S1B2V3_ARCPL|nr:unnamed protein product [Arctia plantaginis]